MVNKQLFQDILARLRDATLMKKPEMWEIRTWMLHHDNVPAYASLLIPSYLAKQDKIVCGKTTNAQGISGFLLKRSKFFYPDMFRHMVTILRWS
jgi:hypothetical protein